MTRIKINNLFNILYNSINLNNLISLRHLLSSDIYNKKINFNNVYKVHNVIINYIINFILI